MSTRVTRSGLGSSDSKLGINLDGTEVQSVLNPHILNLTELLRMIDQEVNGYSALVEVNGFNALMKAANSELRELDAEVEPLHDFVQEIKRRAIAASAKGQEGGAS